MRNNQMDEATSQSDAVYQLGEVENPLSNRGAVDLLCVKLEASDNIVCRPVSYFLRLFQVCFLCIETILVSPCACLALCLSKFVLTLYRSVLCASEQWVCNSSCCCMRPFLCPMVVRAPLPHAWYFQLQSQSREMMSR